MIPKMHTLSSTVEASVKKIYTYTVYIFIYKMAPSPVQHNSSLVKPQDLKLISKEVIKIMF